MEKVSEVSEMSEVYQMPLSFAEDLDGRVKMLYLEKC